MIVGVSGTPIESRADLARALAALGADDSLVLAVARRDGEVEVVIEPAQRVD